MVLRLAHPRAEAISEKSRFDHHIRALHRRAGLVKT
jgi:hypothetical protein